MATLLKELALEPVMISSRGGTARGQRLWGCCFSFSPFCAAQIQ